MTVQDYNDSVAIISASKGVKCSFNENVNKSSKLSYPILIHENEPDLITDLVLQGYELRMTPKGLCVENRIHIDKLCNKKK